MLDTGTNDDTKLAGLLLAGLTKKLGDELHPDFLVRAADEAVEYGGGLTRETARLMTSRERALVDECWRSLVQEHARAA